MYKMALEVIANTISMIIMMIYDDNDDIISYSLSASTTNYRPSYAIS